MTINLRWRVDLPTSRTTWKLVTRASIILEEHRAHMPQALRARRPSRAVAVVKSIPSSLICWIGASHNRGTTVTTREITSLRITWLRTKSWAIWQTRMRWRRDLKKDSNRITTRRTVALLTQRAMNRARCLDSLATALLVRQMLSESSRILWLMTFQRTTSSLAQLEKWV